VTIAPYHRLVTEFPDPAAGDPLAAVRAVPGVRAEPVPGGPTLPPPRGVAYLYLGGAGGPGGRFVAVTLPDDPGAPLVDNLDHTRVERLLVRTAFGLDPDDKRVGYVGGDYPVSWLRDQVDSGQAVAAVIIAPVTIEDFIAVNLARQKMPRKSTWFTPKARAGLVLAELG
jgi:hypothetical protein